MDIVLGAGIAGLGYAYGSDFNCVIYEKNEYVGGLCHSFDVEGFRFDTAVHFSFTENETVREIFDKTPHWKHLPVSYNFYHNKWIKHPVVNNLYEFSVQEKVQFIEDFIMRDKNIEIHNYEDYLYASYGKSITDVFFKTYTKKYWTMDAKDMSTTWVGNRLCTPDLHKVLIGAFSNETAIDYYAKEMRYPKEGGYEAFIKGLEEKATIKRNKSVVSLDIRKREVEFSDGEKVSYDRVISSIPLPELVKTTKNVPEQVKNAANRLKASKVSIVSVGIKGDNAAKWLWQYVYDEDIWAARINSPSVKSKNNAPSGCSSLQFEIYHAPTEKIESEAVLKNVKYAINKMKLCKEEDILFMDYRLIPYGNVIFYAKMEEDREIVRNFYKERCELIGRFGEWDYLWSDQSFISGYMKGINKDKKGKWYGYEH